jgi:hypothetical protein
VRRMAEQLGRSSLLPAGLSSEEYFEQLHISWGSPEEVATRLATDEVLPLASDLIVQFSPATPTLDQAIAALELMAKEVAPALGWHPARPAALTPT